MILSPRSFIVEKIGGFLFPPLCVSCTKTTHGKGLALWLCNDCQKKLSENASNRDPCPICAQNRRKTSCECQDTFSSSVQSCHSLLDFDDTLKSVIHEFKYGGYKKLACNAAQAFAGTIPESFFKDMDIMASVPLHFFRYVKRGYNQSDYLAQGVAKGNSFAPEFIPKIIKRRRHTKTQTHLSRDERMENMRHAFFVPVSQIPFIENKNIVLVDDVITTGATTGICAKALIRAGAKTVKVLSLARD
jgi:ComF family protein